MADVVNFYEQAVMRPYLQADDTDTSSTEIPVGSRVLIVGASGSGKTNLVASFIAHSPNVYRKAIVFCKTLPESDPIYAMMNDRLGERDQIEFHHTLSELPNIEKLRSAYEKTDNLILVIDDFLFDLEKSDMFKNYMIRCRKHRVTLVCLVQSFFKVQKAMREQFSDVFLFRLNSKDDRTRIRAETCYGRDDIWRAYLDTTKVKMQAFRVRQDTQDMEHKYARNFTAWFRFPDEEGGVCGCAPGGRK